MAIAMEKNILYTVDYKCLLKTVLKTINLKK